MQNFNWLRCWYKITKLPNIPDGFLSTFGDYETTALPFNKFSSTPCLVMLGEPGMGKSKEIERIAKEENNDENTNI